MQYTFTSRLRTPPPVQNTDTTANALTLGLGLVFSEVCIPLTTRCLRAPLLYIGGACSLARSHQPCLWCGHRRVPKGTRPAAFQPEA